MKDLSLNDIIDILEADDVATYNEVQLVADILGNTMEAVDAIISVRTEYDDFDEYYRNRDINE